MLSPYYPVPKMAWMDETYRDHGPIQVIHCEFNLNKTTVKEHKQYLDAKICVANPIISSLTCSNTPLSSTRDFMWSVHDTKIHLTCRRKVKPKS